MCVSVGSLFRICEDLGPFHAKHIRVRDSDNFAEAVNLIVEGFIEKALPFLPALVFLLKNGAARSLISLATGGLDGVLFPHFPALLARGPMFSASLFTDP